MPAKTTSSSKSGRPDDFSHETKELLAKRVGHQCANPNCRLPTSGPATDSKKSVNVGVAAHITAASPGGPRYDSALSTEQRRSPDNGIWCCQTCAKLVDSDNARFTVDLIKEWRRISEQSALLAIEHPSKGTPPAYSDRDLIAFYAQCFDRPAFQDHFRQERSTWDFDNAIEDTITAINTGCLRSRNGQVLSQSKGKVYLTNPTWRQQMDTVVDLLVAIRSSFDTGKKLGMIHSTDTFFCINDERTCAWMDDTRDEVLRAFGEVAVAAGLNPPRGLNARTRHHY